MNRFVVSIKKKQLAMPRKGAKVEEQVHVSYTAKRHGLVTFSSASLETNLYLRPTAEIFECSLAKPDSPLFVERR